MSPTPLPVHITNSLPIHIQQQQPTEAAAACPCLFATCRRQCAHNKIYYELARVDNISQQRRTISPNQPSSPPPSIPCHTNRANLPLLTQSATKRQTNKHPHKNTTSRDDDGSNVTGKVRASQIVFHAIKEWHSVRVLSSPPSPWLAAWRNACLCRISVGLPRNTRQ